MDRMTIKQRMLSIILAVVLVAAAFPPGSSYASPDDSSGGEGGAHGAEEVIVVYEDSSACDALDDAEGMGALSAEEENYSGEEAAEKQAQIEEVQELIKENDGEEEVLVESFFDAGQAVKVTLPDEMSAEEFIEQAEQLEGVQYVQKNYTYALIEPVAEVVEDDALIAEGENGAQSAASLLETESEGAAIPEEAPAEENEDESAPLDDDAPLSDEDESLVASSPEIEPEAEVSEESGIDPQGTEAEGETSEETTADILAIPNDPYAQPSNENHQYYLGSWSAANRGANIFNAWNKAQAAGTVTVAVLDTGARATHEDISANLNKTYMTDIYYDWEQGSITDYDGHGTHVCGIVAGVAGNGKGIAGVSYNAKVLPIKVFDNSLNPKTSTAILIKAYSYLGTLVDQRKITNLRVINMSLGGYGAMGEQDLILKSAIGKMRNDYNVLTVCAGGNGDSRGNPILENSWPGDYEECMAVTSLEKNGTNSYWSDYNKAKDISAPGRDITSTYHSQNNSYALMSGTSMASPVVAGVAALLWSYKPNLTVNEVVRAMQASANKVNPAANDRTGKTGSAGAVDALAAIEYVQSGKTTSTGTDISKCAIAKIDNQILVNGTAKPKLKITYNGTTLKEGTDYSVEYLIIPGSSTAYATAKGLGKYYGLKRTSFPVSSVSWSRLAGVDRYKTMSKIVQAGFKANDAKTVIVATGENYPDALAASALAGLHSAPIVLTSKTSLNADAKGEIQRLGATKALIIGSEAALSSAVEKSIKALGVTTERVKGATRVETAVEIYKAGTKAPNKWKTTAIIASSQGFADALSISSFAYSKGYPIFLADGNKTLTKGALDSLKSGGFKNIIIVGSEVVVAKSVVSQLTNIGIGAKNITRLGGADRYQTSLKIAEYAVKNGLTANRMAVATGANFPDALSGAALCGKTNSVIFLVADNTVAKGYVKTFISSNRSTLRTAYALGSNKVVSDSLLSYLRTISS